MFVKRKNVCEVEVYKIEAKCKLTHLCFFIPSTCNDSAKKASSSRRDRKVTLQSNHINYEYLKEADQISFFQVWVQEIAKRGSRSCVFGHDDILHSKDE